MEVAASLPNVLKVFPLRIISREDFPAIQQVAFPPDVATLTADKEMEEGEIDLNDSGTHGGAHGIFKEQQYSCCNVVEPTFAHIQSTPHSDVNLSTATSATPLSPSLSNLTNGWQLECSVGALLSLPDKLSLQSQIKHCNGQITSQSQSRIQRPLFNESQVESPTKQAHSLLRSQVSLSAKQRSSPPKLAASPTLSLPSKQSRACILPQASTPFSSSWKPIKVFSQPKKLDVLSPKAQQPPISSTAEKCFKASLPLKKSLTLKSLSVRGDQPHARSPAGNVSPTHRHQLPSSSESIHTSPAPQSPSVVATSKQLSEGLPTTLAPPKYLHQVSSHSLGSLSGKETLVDVGLTSEELTPLTSPPVMNQRHEKRAFVFFKSGNKRPRSSAIRDYPAGCGRNVFLKMHSEVDKSNVCHDKSSLEMQGVKDHILPDQILISPIKQVIKEVAHQEPNPQHLAGRKEDTAATCAYKSLKTSALSLILQRTQVSSKRKHDARSSPDSLLNKAQERLKVRPVSHLLSSVEERLLSSIPHDKEVRTDWLPAEQFHCTASAEREMKFQNGRTHQWMPLGGLMLAKKFSKRLEAVDKLLPLEAKGGVCARSLVKKTLQEFDCVRRSLAICKDRHQRPDLAAAKILKNNGWWRNCENGKILGDVPGVEVGDQFSFRIEMLVIGLHRQIQGGIDFISGNARTEGPLATSIVASGGYEDDEDCGDTFIYTGQGGNNYKGDRRQACDQVLQRGNLALSNSCKERTPVRVIRGSTDDKFYTYDGLYDVIKCWFQTGSSGFGVYQFMLCRRPGQPELGSAIVRFMGTVKKKGLARPHVLLGDLSNGEETLPVCVVNEVDEEVAPLHFRYIPKMKYPNWYRPVIPKGCDCVGGCVDASKCLCAAKNGGEFPYNEFGQIVRGKDVVFECGQSCACSSSCHNRVSQRGPRHILEVFKTRKRGWGVRSLEPIRPGDIICEYAGELLSDADAEQRTEHDEYLFDIGNKVGARSDVCDLMGVAVANAIVPVVEDAGFAIDARLYGSVARFINHSCSPNLYAQNVVYDGDDLRFPHVILFAMENVPPMRELSYDYNYTIGHVRDANNNVKAKACYCEAQDCRGRLY